MGLMESLSENVKNLRRASGLTLEEYAEEVGISKTTLQEIASGNGNPTAQTMEAIARYHNLPPVYLFMDYKKSELEVTELLLRNLRMFDGLTGSRWLEALEHIHALLHLFLPDDDMRSI